MNVLITAGGTVEKIDSIRSIVNFSTGKLGSLIADAFAMSEEVNHVYYLCNKTAVLPQTEKAEIIHISSVKCLQNTLTEIINRVSMDVIVHSMAVSDYRVKTVTTLSNIQSASRFKAEIKPIMTQTQKIDSGIDGLTIILEKTPKIISTLRKLSSHSVIFGFKLLDSVPLDTLIDEGYRVLVNNGCSFVLANDFSCIDDFRHVGYLIDEHKNFTKHDTKKEIADAIVAAALAKRRSVQ